MAYHFFNDDDTRYPICDAIRTTYDGPLPRLGIECAGFDPCGNAPAEGDYLARQRQNVESLAAVFTPP